MHAGSIGLIRSLPAATREELWAQKIQKPKSISLVVPQEITDFDKFRTTLGEVLEVIKVSEDKEAMKQLLATNPQFVAMDNESVSAINTFIGTNIPINEKGSVTDMCKAWEDQRMDGLLAGRKEGREEGREEGLVETAKNLKCNGVPLELITKCTGLSIETIEAL